MSHDLATILSEWFLEIILLFFRSTENLADDDVKPLPKIDPSVVNKWAGEDEDDDIKVSGNFWQINPCILLK